MEKREETRVEERESTSLRHPQQQIQGQNLPLENGYF
jgi:hypothetical protein